MGLIDGLGGEEIGQAGSQVSQIWITGSIVSDDAIKGVNISGTTAVRGANVINAEGELQSVLLGSATTSVYGGIIQVGSGATSAGSIGYVKLGVPTASATFYTQLTQRTFSADGGSVAPFTSGTYSTSGVSFVGAASTSYDWIVVGA